MAHDTTKHPARALAAAAIALGLALGMGCEPSGSDISTGPSPDDPPDITGTYQATPLDVQGCEGQADLEWMTGALAVAGTASSLTFTFADGSVLDGSVDTAFTFEASGTVSHGGETQEVFLDGLAFIGDETWELDADVTADLLDSTGQATACTLTGLLEATQNP